MRVPPRWRDRLVIIGAMVFAAALVYPDVLFGGRTLATTALHSGVTGSPPHAGYPDGAPVEHNPVLRDPAVSAVSSKPAGEYANQALSDPGMLLWDRSGGLGQPQLATATPQLVSPIRWPVALAPTPLVWDLFLIARLVVTGALIGLLARRLGMRRGGAVVAGLAAGFGGFTALHLNGVHVDQLVALALALTAAEGYARMRSPTRFLGLAAALTLVLVADNLQAGLLGLGLAVPFAAARLHHHGADHPVRAVGVAAGAVAAAVGLAAVVLVPLMELAGTPINEPLADHSHRAGSGMGLATLPLQAIGDLLVPHLRLAIEDGRFDINATLGVATTLLALLGLRSRHRGLSILLGVVAGLLLAKIFGLPVIGRLGHLPVASSINFLLYTAAPLTICWGLLAGLGADRLTDGVPTVHLLGLGVVVTALTLGAVAWRPGPDPAGGLALAGLFLVPAWVLVAAAVTARGHPAATIAGALVLVELVVIGVPTLGVVLPDGLEPALPVDPVARPYRSEPFAAPPWLHDLQAMAGPADRLIGLDGVLFPNSSAAFGLEDIRDMTAFPLRRSQSLIAEFIDPERAWRFNGAGWHGFSSFRAHPRLRAVLDLVGVEWVLDRRALEPGRAPLPPGLEVVVDGPVDVMRNHRAFPRAFVVHDVVPVADRAAALSVMAEPDVDLRETAVVETGGGELRLSGSGTAAATLVGYGADRTTVRVRTDHPGLLVVASSYYPGWRATVDGRPAEVLPVDAALQGTPVPAGTHTVRLVFRPTSVAIGAIVSLATLLGLLVPVGLGFLRRGRRSDTTGGTADGTTSDPVARQADPAGSGRTGDIGLGVDG